MIEAFVMLAVAGHYAHGSGLPAADFIAGQATQDTHGIGLQAGVCLCVLATHKKPGRCLRYGSSYCLPATGQGCAQGSVHPF
mgnify:CR=1 FL=1